jgi:broad specificity phosphatase PhoE
MNNGLPIIYIARHGETAWTITGQHTGRTDLPLTPRGECNARALAPRFAGMNLAKVFTSPLQRARRTCELAGFASAAEADPDLVEWGYGDYEGKRSCDILAGRPGWELFRDGCPGGESLGDVIHRADRFISRLQGITDGNVLIFSSGHFIRVLALQWIGVEPNQHCVSFILSTASVSAIGYEPNLTRRVIRLWNDTQHVRN